MNFIRAKKSFTLIELIIVILIIFASYFLIFSNKSFKINQNNFKVNIENLKYFLLDNFIFEKEISFVCIENEFTCFIKIDDVIKEDIKFKNFFLEVPEVYRYDKEQIQVEFNQININDINYDVIFELIINNDYKSNEFILDTKNKGVYIFNSIYKKPFRFDNLSSAFEVFYENQVEVRDAF